MRKAITQRRTNCRACCFRETGLRNDLNSGSASCMISTGGSFLSVWRMVPFITTILPKFAERRKPPFVSPHTSKKAQLQKFKRKDVSYTYRFEQFVLRSLIGSTAEEVARRLGISAETVDRIVENQLTEDRQIDPQRVITDIGLDELSLKKRHRLYVTLMSDLSDPTRPQILAVERGRDTTATLKCLDRLTQE